MARMPLLAAAAVEGCQRLVHLWATAPLGGQLAGAAGTGLWHPTMVIMAA